MHRSFLVTSVGAYLDSGIGTGGFVCVHDGRATIIDKIDSTGLFVSGGRFYRFARGLQSIIGYDADGPHYRLRLPGGGDVHDLLFDEGLFICVATGSNEVLWIDPLGNVVRRWKAEGHGDAWHLNCLWKEGEQLYFSAFGRFAQHRGWHRNCTGTGVVFEFGTNRDIVTGLSGPHNPRLLDGQWVVCDSHASALVISDGRGSVETVKLNGFTRGLAFDSEYLYVGESADRKVENPSGTSSIAVLDRRTRQVVDRIEIPFPEIYEVAIIPEELSARIVSDVARFQLDSSAARISQLEEQVELGVREATAWRERVENLKTAEAIWTTMVNLKRKLVG